VTEARMDNEDVTPRPAAKDSEADVPGLPAQTDNAVTQRQGPPLERIEMLRKSWAEFIRREKQDLWEFAIDVWKKVDRWRHLVFLRRMAHFWENVMALTDDDRCNVTKDFEYFDTRHFDAHVACVNRTISYDWLIYESEHVESDWHWYTERLKAKLSKQFNRTKEEAESIVSGQIKCKVIPVSSEQISTIPFRVTMFGEDICLCGAEPRRHSYYVGVDTVALGCACFEQRSPSLPSDALPSRRAKGSVSNVKPAFTKLWNVSPFIAELEDWKKGREKTTEPPNSGLGELKKAHDALRRLLLHELIENYAEDMAITYSESNLAVAWVVGVIAVVALLIQRGMGQYLASRYKIVVTVVLIVLLIRFLWKRVPRLHKSRRRA
jgi:hypothetical protein